MVARLVPPATTPSVERERLAGEDDDEDHPWAVLTDAPELVLELLVEEYDGWLDAATDEPATRGRPARAPDRAAEDQAPLLTLLR